MRPVHLIGLFLWRGGLLLAAAVAAFEIARRVVQLIDLPFALELGTALVVAGLALVILSLILERIRDARTERWLHE